jgi:hypothetical protein
MKSRHVVLAALLACLGVAAHAGVTTSDAWVRATVGGQKATGAFMQINSTEAVRVVGVASPAAKIVELHEMKMDGDRMMMNAVEGVDVTPGKATELKPGGFHIMLVDVVKPLTAGDKVPLTLVIESSDHKRSNIEVTAEVRAMGAAAGMKHMHH